MKHADLRKKKPKLVTHRNISSTEIDKHGWLHLWRSSPRLADGRPGDFTYPAGIWDTVELDAEGVATVVLLVQA